MAAARARRLGADPEQAEVVVVAGPGQAQEGGVGAGLARHDRHVEGLLVEGDAALQVGHEQHGVVEADGVDGHGEALLWSWCRGRSGDDAEAAGPGDLLAGGEGDLQEAERLELAGALSEPASIAFRPPEVMTPARVDLASASSPAIRTVVVSGPTVPAARVPAKVVLKALSTRDCGSAAAISAAAEPSAGTVEGVEGLEVQRVGDVDDDLAGEAARRARR